MVQNKGSLKGLKMKTREGKPVVRLLGRGSWNVGQWDTVHIEALARIYRCGFLQKAEGLYPQVEQFKTLQSPKMPRERSWQLIP